jgi:hypothetical protein
MSRAEFEQRFKARFSDPAFADKTSAIEELLDVAWEAYCEARKSPSTRKAGPGFADPNYELSVDWLQARAAIQQAQSRHDEPSRRQRVLLICGAARNDKTTRWIETSLYTKKFATLRGPWFRISRHAGKSNPFPRNKPSIHAPNRNPVTASMVRVEGCVGGGLLHRSRLYWR